MLTVVNTVKDGSSTYTLSTQGIGLVVMLSISLVLPIIIGCMITNDLHMRLLRSIHITGKSARESIWLDLFLNNKQSAIINFNDGKRITGFPQYYSDDPSSQYLYLYKPAWILYNEEDKKDEFVDMDDVEGILITPQEKIESIMFLKTKE